MESNKDIIRDYVSKFNAGDLSGIVHLFSKDAQIHGVLGWGSLDVVLPIWEQLVNGLSIHLKIESIIAEGNHVAVKYTETGTSRAPFFDKPATGKTYKLLAMEWFLIQDHKIHKRWGARDAASQAFQLGWNNAATKDDVQIAKG